jgi:L-threonylcarbamoyladenylate synthase
MKTELLPAEHPHALPQALNVLRNSGIVAFPTDTVYGLGAIAFDLKGVDRLYGVKGRSHTKAIAILLAHPDSLAEVATEVSEDARRLAEAFWPGPLTLILTRHPKVPSVLSPSPTIGVRIPDHPIALDLLQAAGPMAVTSANLSGRENTCTTQEVLAQLDGRVHLVIDGGRTPGGVPSTVIDCTQPQLQVVREGPIKAEQFLKALSG